MSSRDSCYHAPRVFSVIVHADLIAALKSIVGTRNVMVGRAARRYCTGFRYGHGHAHGVVRPGTLLDQWHVLKACVDANVIVIPQAANTGLTGGSTPDGHGYDRPIIIINTMRLNKVYIIDEGRQAICLPGSTLNQLEKVLKPLGREPHSVIGSSCIGASVIGGICNNSGGSLLRRGPAYTEMAVFARVNTEGQLHLQNNLGANLGGTPEDILGRLDRRDFVDEDILAQPKRGSDRDYSRQVRDIEANSPARYNADPRLLYEASGSAGKVMVFAVRLDTFPLETSTKVFYVGTNHPSDFTHIRRRILGHCTSLPIAGEYLHRDAFNMAERYGKDTFFLIKYLGTDRLPAFFAIKRWIDALLERIAFFPHNLTERALQALGAVLPNHLPIKLRDYRDRFEHHLLIKVSSNSVTEFRDLLDDCCAQRNAEFFTCSDAEGEAAFLHRFTVAGAAVRFRTVHWDIVENIIALDIALQRNERDWFETLPTQIETAIYAKVYYGHFFCHVFHQDYIVKKGHACGALKYLLLRLLDGRGAEYPAEHNVGHLYDAKPALRAFYRNLDPRNCFNPGLGHTSKLADYGARPVKE